MEIKEILDKLDSKLFTDEVKKELVESFSIAVNTKIAEVTEKLETEYIDKEIALEKKYTKKIENFYESERNHISGHLEEVKKEMNEQLVTKYSDEVLVEDALKMYRKMQNFISESASKLNTKPEVESELERIKKENVKLRESKELEVKKFNEMSRFALIKEIEESIKHKSVKEQFVKLSEEIEFNGDVKNFKRKLDRINENLTNEYENLIKSLKKEVVRESQEVKPKPIVESKPKIDRLKMIKESMKNRTRHETVVESEKETDMESDVDMYLN